MKGVRTLVDDYCDEWNPDNDPGSIFCYLKGGLNSSHCPGAKRSGQGEFYLTKDPDFCKSTEGAGKSKSVSKNVLV